MDINRTPNTLYSNIRQREAEGMGSDMLYFPPEIITNILKRLPVKSLIRFQCVCKDWKNLVKTQSFVANHLQHQKPCLLFKFYYDPWRRCLHLLDGGLQVRHIQFIDSLLRAIIVGSCNGLICLQIGLYNESPPLLSLWNPATTEVIHLPKTRTDSLFFDHCVAGFGFSEVVNDYKIVKSYVDFYDNNRVVEVFSLSRGTWKAIDFGNLKHVHLNSESVTVNGAIFWFGVKLCGAEVGEDNIEVEEGEDEFQVIVSFDIVKEVFTVIPRPDLAYIADEKLAVYENKLALLCKIWENNDETSSWIDLWVLDGGAGPSGKKWSWTKRYNSSPFPCTMALMAIWDNKIVCTPNYKEDIEKGRNVLCLMNPSTNEVKRFAIPYCSPSHDIYNYVESLVSIGYN